MLPGVTRSVIVPAHDPHFIINLNVFDGQYSYSDGLDIRITIRIQYPNPSPGGTGADRSREAFADPLACILKGYLLVLSIVFENFNVLSAFFDAFGVTRSVIVLAHDPYFVLFHWKRTLYYLALTG